MPTGVIRFTVELTIHEGKFNEFERLILAMIASSLKEPGTLGYDFFLSDDRQRCHLLETYKDADAVQAHLAGPAVQEMLPKLLEMSSAGGFAVYGDPGLTAAPVLKEKGAQIFGSWHLLGR